MDNKMLNKTMEMNVYESIQKEEYSQPKFEEKVKGEANKTGEKAFDVNAEISRKMMKDAISGNSDFSGDSGENLNMTEVQEKKLAKTLALPNMQAMNAESLKKAGDLAKGK